MDYIRSFSKLKIRMENMKSIKILHINFKNLRYLLSALNNIRIDKIEEFHIGIQGRYMSKPGKLFLPQIVRIAPQVTEVCSLKLMELKCHHIKRLLTSFTSLKILSLDDA